MIDWKSFKSDRSMKYLHDRCRMDSTITHSERFAITSSPNPKQTMIYRSRANRDVQAAKNYLRTVWA